jgi:hypothetical protein
MHHALSYLMLLQLRGLLRRGLRQARTPRGALFFIFGLIVFALWLLPALLTADIAKPAPAEVRNVIPLVLLGITLLTTLTSAGEKAIAFTGGEVDFLFPGPFTRRQLMLFKLVKGAFISILSGLVISIPILRNATYWIACYLGCAFSLMFVQYAGTVALLIGQSVGERTRARGKLLVVAVIVGLIVLALHSVAGPHWWDALMADPRDMLQKFAVTLPGRILLAPFYVLTMVLTADDLANQLPLWTLVAVAMNGALVALILVLDSGFMEAAAGASERRYERMRRFRSGGALNASVGAEPGAKPASDRSRRPLPMLPWLGGAGPIAWRQLTHARRAGKSLLIVLLLLAASVGPIFIASARNDNPLAVTIPVLSILAWMSILLASVLRFDFRADLDSIETLKTLPLRPSAVAAGQLIAPTLVMTLIHWIVVVATLVITARQPTGDAIRGPMLVAAVVALPFNLLMFVAENLIFLLAPTRPSGSGPGDFSLLGKQIFTLMIRTLGVGIAAFIAGALAAGVYFVLTWANVPAGLTLAAATAAAFVVLSIEGIATVPLVGLAFRRFDPSVHMPA